MKKITTLLLAFLPFLTFSQTQTDSLAQRVASIEKTVAALKNLKFSGYFHGQYQVADTAGIESYNGGDFGPQVDNRYMVRRGRLKAAYTGEHAEYVLQIDVTEKGVSTKDAYIKIFDPWKGNMSLTTGLFIKPFGHELYYSSSKRESPERGRMSQIIFPGERDLGAMLSYKLPGKLNMLTANAAVFSGSGSKSSDFDSRKDFFGNLSLDKALANNKVNLEAGVSAYNGGWLQNNKVVYRNVETLPTGIKYFKADTSDSNINEIAERQYLGVNAGIKFKTPIGQTQLRGEYITGTQPGKAGSSDSFTSANTGATYLRNFDGAYLYFIQNLGKSKHQLLVKYDWYDPNTDVEGNDIGITGTNLSSTDIKYSTLGLGYIWNIDSNLKLVLCYDLVTNETSENLSGYTSDRTDNLFTTRIQFKF